ncbi:mitochondrial protein C2orf69-like [Lineus longissimus]|uniref:mitochondrial protein C2orf69-like n=1 Tax=Lineus longissimus TaxID=88925 RepID=UPI00315CF3E2
MSCIVKFGRSLLGTIVALRTLTVTVIPMFCASVMSAGVSSEAFDIRVERSIRPGKDKAVCRRLIGIVGDGEKVNDVIFCGLSSAAESNVVFFGGDVQDYKENMMNHRDNHRYKEWNLESTAQLLHKRFPKSHVWVVKPSRMHLKTFSVYQNFVESNDFGAPTHNSDHGGFKHLNALLHNAISMARLPGKCSSDCDNGSVDLEKKYSSDHQKESGLGEQNGELSKGVCAVSNGQNSISVECSLEKPLILSAFSKGCIVLNQFIYELENAKEEPELKDLVEKIHSLYWLDGGHSGGSNTWIVHLFVLKNLIGLNLNVFVHVTPYQIRDEMRVWIGKEERKFVDRLQKMGVKVTEVVHFDEEERSLCNHFNVLTNF